MQCSVRPACPDRTCWSAPSSVPTRSSTTSEVSPRTSPVSSWVSPRGLDPNGYAGVGELIPEADRAGYDQYHHGGNEISLDFMASADELAAMPLAPLVPAVVVQGDQVEDGMTEAYEAVYRAAREATAKRWARAFSSPPSKATPSGLSNRNSWSRQQATWWKLCATRAVGNRRPRHPSLPPRSSMADSTSVSGRFISTAKDQAVRLSFLRWTATARRRWMDSVRSCRRWPQSLVSARTIDWGRG